MTKIMLVEDDKSLREIYGVRLLAEGYDIVSAGDGEEALAMAIKERPELIVSDVMMPKISGFDMLDILRSTTETKNIKVIMMTALSSEEQRARGESLGADRYLVKSQVGIEDVVRVVHEVLGDQAAAASPNGQPSGPVSVPPSNPVSNIPAAPQPPAPTAEPALPKPTMPVPGTTPASPVTSTAPSTEATSGAGMKAPSNTPKPPSQRARIIQPLNDPNISPVDMDDLFNKELAKESSNSSDTIATAEQEKAVIDQQLADFTLPPMDLSTPPLELNPIESKDDTPGITINVDGSIVPETPSSTPDITPAFTTMSPVLPATPPPVPAPAAATPAPTAPAASPAPIAPTTPPAVVGSPVITPSAPSVSVPAFTPPTTPPPVPAAAATPAPAAPAPAASPAPIAPTTPPAPKTITVTQTDTPTASPPVLPPPVGPPAA